MTNAVRVFAVAGMLSVALSLFAQAVEYVRVCDDYGSKYSYVPGTDICINAMTGETRSETEGGTWIAHAGRLPGNWVASPKADCLLGRVVKVATFTRADLALNSRSRYETGPVCSPLGPREFISKVMIRGGFNANSRSNFCLAFHDATLDEYSMLGCHDTAPLRDQEAIWSFTPLRSTAPATYATPSTLVGVSGSELWPSPETTFEGEMECWVCVQRARR